MTMTPFNGDLTQALKWMQNEAPNLQELISQKAAWYQTFHTNFWKDWETSVFDLRTANNFGLAVWCAILGLPQTPFNLVPIANAWAFGANRQNFVYSGIDLALPNPNTTGGNFYGSSQDNLNSLDEVRYALQLRYVALTGNCRISLINRMLQYILNGGKPWDLANKKYAYVADSTMYAQAPTNISIYRQDWQGNQLMYATARKNQYPQSETFGTNTQTSLTKTTATGAGPGGIDVLSLVPTTANVVHYMNASNYGNQQGNQFTFSVYAKANGYNFLRLDIYDSTNHGAYFDLSAGVVATQLPNGNATFSAAISPVQGAPGWYKCSVSMAPNNTTIMQTNLWCSQSNGQLAFAGDGVSGILVKGPQLEPSSVAAPLPTSYTANASSNPLVGTTVTDYTLDSAGNVTFAVAPLSGAALTYSGQFKQGNAVNQSFGTGNGSQTAFALSTPPGGGSPTSGAFKVEYRFGKGLGLSGQFINLLNGGYGILPAPAGSSVLAIQES